MDLFTYTSSIPQNHYLFHNTDLLVSPSSFPFNDSWTLWGPRRPLATRRAFRNVGFDLQFCCFIYWSCCCIYRSNIAFVRTILRWPRLQRCWHLIDSVSPSPISRFHQRFCASFFVLGFRSISIVSGVSSVEFLLDRCAEMCFWAWFYSARPTDSSESTALPLSITGFL